MNTCNTCPWNPKSPTFKNNGHWRQTIYDSKKPQICHSKDENGLLLFGQMITPTNDSNSCKGFADYIAEKELCNEDYYNQFEE